jgi:hypothetical protein
VEAQAQLCPAIARIVIFGDGQPANVALIQPLPGSQSQLPEQIARLSQQFARLRHIHHWLPVALDQLPGLLTANGPRRNEIYHHFSRQISQCLTGETSWLLPDPAASHRRERERLFNAPIIEACRRGIGRDTYLAFLAQAYYHVRHTVPLLMATGGKLGQEYEWVRGAIQGVH